MVVTNSLKQYLAYALGSVISNQQINYLALGTTSGTIGVTSTTLTGSEFTRVAMTGSANFNTNNVVVLQGDLNSVMSSGLILKQFGWFNANNSSANTGSVYDINSINGSIVCDGTIEIQFQTALEVI